MFYLQRWWWWWWWCVRLRDFNAACICLAFDLFKHDESSILWSHCICRFGLSCFIFPFWNLCFGIFRLTQYQRSGSQICHNANFKRIRTRRLFLLLLSLEISHICRWRVQVHFNESKTMPKKLHFFCPFRAFNTASIAFISLLLSTGSNCRIKNKIWDRYAQQMAFVLFPLYWWRDRISQALQLGNYVMVISLCIVSAAAYSPIWQTLTHTDTHRANTFAFVK